jgi:hypothetical protein
VWVSVRALVKRAVASPALNVGLAVVRAIGLPAACGRPQLWQKRAVAGNSVPQFAHAFTNGCPQLTQKRAASTLTVPQLGQFITWIGYPKTDQRHSRLVKMTTPLPDLS